MSRVNFNRNLEKNLSVGHTFEITEFVKFIILCILKCLYINNNLFLFIHHTDFDKSRL